MNNRGTVAIIGGGLAGVEASFLLARNDISVDLYEMRPERLTEAHRTGYLAELVCSNSLKSNLIENPQGLIKEELRILGSIVVIAADKTSVPAGESLSVDRDLFSKHVSATIASHPNIKIIRRHISRIDELMSRYDYVVAATGPLTTPELVDDLRRVIREEDLLYFYDAISPIITAESIDMSKAFYGSRNNKGGDDYINCPLSEDEYRVLYEMLMSAELVEPHIDEPLRFFDGCMPIEEIARSGYRSLSFGPFKPVGFKFESGKRPFAIVQLRRENRAGTLYSIVAFQTRMKYGYQKKVINLIPALRDCEIIRYGQMHRNLYINSPSVLNRDLSFISQRNLFLAGTITGVEGYIEAAASGLLTGLSIYSIIRGKMFIPPPDMTAIGLLYRYITGKISIARRFIPTNMNKGLFLHYGERRYVKEMAYRAIEKIREYRAIMGI